jgi:hypothetical protein
MFIFVLSGEQAGLSRPVFPSPEKDDGSDGVGYISDDCTTSSSGIQREQWSLDIVITCYLLAVRWPLKPIETSFT